MWGVLIATALGLIGGIALATVEPKVTPVPARLDGMVIYLRPAEGLICRCEIKDLAPSCVCLGSCGPASDAEV